jgi:hypothetical protein
MRLVYAGTFILVGLLGFLVFMNRRYPNVDSALMGHLMEGILVILVVAAYFLFNKRGAWKLKNADVVGMYRGKGELTEETYHAKRSLALADHWNKVTWYVVELENGQPICLWDRLPAGRPGVDPENPNACRFPCTEFTILRHTTGFIVDIVCSGEVIKPEEFRLRSKPRGWGYDFFLADGEVIPGETFDSVRAKVVKAVKPW